MAITIPDIPEVHEKASELFTASKNLLRFMERVMKALGDEKLVELTPEQKQFLLQKYTEFRTAAQAAAADLME